MDRFAIQTTFFIAWSVNATLTRLDKMACRFNMVCNNNIGCYAYMPCWPLRTPLWGDRRVARSRHGMTSSARDAKKRRLVGYVVRTVTFCNCFGQSEADSIRTWKVGLGAYIHVSFEPIAMSTCRSSLRLPGRKRSRKSPWPSRRVQSCSIDQASKA